ncbi:hypothetical protein [Stenotrophomonas sp.]|uniref:hypothetical protein n=1 Tax=Stenotrophomonas sp. TaxID=69392 RepID=UPI002FC6F3BF
MTAATASRRTFLQLAGTGLALSASGLATAPAVAAAPAPAGPVLLNFNQCPYGPAPAAQAAARDIVAGSGRYRFALAGELRDLFAVQAGLGKEQVRLRTASWSMCSATARRSVRRWRHAAW